MTENMENNTALETDALTEAQFAAWLELAELVTDEDFIQRQNEIGRESWGNRRDPAAADWHRNLNRLYYTAAETMKAGHAPDSPGGQQLVAEYIAGHARVAGRQDDGEGGSASHMHSCERSRKYRPSISTFCQRSNRDAASIPWSMRTDGIFGMVCGVIRRRWGADRI